MSAHRMGTLMLFVLFCLVPSQGQQARCAFTIASAKAGKITAQLQCHGGKVEAAVNQKLLGAFRQTFRGVVWNESCTRPGCLITICGATSALITNSSVVQVTDTAIHSILCVANTSSINIQNSTFSHNSARAVYILDNANVVLSFVWVLNNSVAAGNGGGLMLEGSGKVDIIGGRIESNKAIGGSGGGIYADKGSTVNITDSNFIQNSCLLYGGGVAAMGNAAVHLGGISRFENNMAKATQGGGGVAMFDYTELKMSENVVINSSVDQGAAIATFNYSNLDLPVDDMDSASKWAVAKVTKCSNNLLLRTDSCLAGMYKVSVVGICTCCTKNSYRFEFSTGCNPCPLHAACPGGDVILPEPGYWRSSSLSNQVHQCPMSSDACEGEGKCRTGYEGNLCGACAPGYGIISPFKCGKCMQPQQQLGVYVFICFSTVLFVAFTVHSTWKDNLEGSADLRPSDLIKVLVQFLQYLVIIGSVSVPWPDFLKTLFKASSFVFGAASGQALSLDCWLSHFIRSNKPPLAIQRQLVYFLAPVLVFAAVVALQLLWGAASWCWLFVVQQFSSKGQLKSFLLQPPSFLRLVLRKMPVTALVVCYYAYPTLLRAAMGFFACLQIDAAVQMGPASNTTNGQPALLTHQRGYWVSDIQQQCFSGWHKSWAFGLGLPALLLTCVGVPAGLVRLLRGSQQKADDPAFREHYGFLYRNYRSGLMWWEAVWAVQTVLLSLIAAFHFMLGAYYSIILLGLVFFASVALQSLHRPYALHRLHLMHTTSSSCLLLTAQGALVMFSIDKGAAATPAMHNIVAGLMLAMDVGFAAFCSYTIAALATPVLRGRCKALLVQYCGGMAASKP